MLLNTHTHIIDRLGEERRVKRERGEGRREREGGEEGVADLLMIKYCQIVDYILEFNQ